MSAWQEENSKVSNKTDESKSESVIFPGYTTEREMKTNKPFIL